MKRYIRSSETFWGLDLDKFSSLLKGDMTLMQLFDICEGIGRPLTPEVQFSLSFWDRSPFNEIWINDGCSSYDEFISEFKNQSRYRHKTIDEQLANKLVDYVLNLRLPIDAKIEENRTNYMIYNVCDTGFVYDIDGYKFHIAIWLLLGSPFFGGGW